MPAIGTASRPAVPAGLHFFFAGPFTPFSSSSARHATDAVLPRSLKLPLSARWIIVTMSSNGNIHRRPPWLGPFTRAAFRIASKTFALMAAFETPRVEWTPEVLIALVYLAVVVSIGGMALFLFMLKTGTAGKVAANFYLTPGVTAVIGWLVLGEGLPAAAIVGIALASTGVWLVNRSGRPAGA